MNVAVVGTGYVGLVTGACLAEHGHVVTCVDKDWEKIAALNKGAVPIYEPGLEELLERNGRAGRLRFTTSISDAVAVSDIIFIAVGTPSGPDGEADISAVQAAAVEIGQALPGYRVVVNKSTVPVGTAAAMTQLLARLSPRPCDVVSNPEFLRQGAAVQDALHPDRIIIGSSSDRAIRLMQQLYSTFQSPVLLTDARSAEMIKYAANSFLALKISYINEVAALCDRFGANIEDVAQGMGLDPRIGPAFLRAGIGYGGSCFPKDTQAFVHLAHQVGQDLATVQAAIEVNRRQRTTLLWQVRQALGGLQGKAIAILGLAFKPHTDDVREAPALDLMQRIVTEGGAVRAYDPLATANARRAWGAAVDARSQRRAHFCSDPEEAVRKADALILATEWPQFAGLDWRRIHTLMRQHYVFDGRNCLDRAALRAIGFKYSGVGRGDPDVAAPDVYRQQDIPAAGMTD